MQLQQNRDCTAESIAIHCHCFHSLLDEIEKNNTDFNFLCRAAIFLVDNYWQLFSLNFDHYSTLLNYSAPCIFFPLIAMGKFTSEELRDERVRTNLLTHIKDTIENQNKLKDWYGRLCNAKEEGVEAATNFFIVEKSVDSWDDLVQDNKTKVMVFYMKTVSARVRSVRTRDEFAITNVNGVFPIFNGLDYKDVSSVPRMAYLILPDCIAKRCPSYQITVEDE